MRNTTKTLLIHCLALAVLAPLALANNPVPFIGSTTPASAQPGTASFTLTVYGANFVNGSLVRWVQNQTTTALATTYISTRELTATVPASLLAAPGTGALTVGGVSSPSNVVYFPVGPPSTPAYTSQGQTGGNGPVSVAVADFNGDTIPDLVVANSQDNTVTILLGKGDGTFPSGYTTSVGNQPVFVATGDFNNDGIPDVAVANYADSTIDILLGNGDGTFSKGDVISGICSQPASLATGDFNADGNLDLIAVCQTAVYVLLGTGNGTFSAGSMITGDSFAAVAVADFNNDGILDLAVENTQGVVSIWAGEGNGHFNAINYFLTYFNGGSMYMAAGDINGDGNADLAGTSSFDDDGDYFAGYVFLNGDGGSSVSNVLLFNGPSSGLVIAPLNGNGSQDLAIVTGTNTISTFLYTNSGNNPLPEGPSFTVPLAGQLTQVVVADFNGDGTLDMAVGNQSGNIVAILLSPVPIAGLSPGSLTFAPQADGASSAPQPVTLGNTGQIALSIAAIATNGDFSQTNNCGASLAAGSTCTVNVTFTPAVTGTRSGSLTITDNSNGPANSTQTVALTGTGLTPVPVVGPLPSQMLFPNQPVNTTSASQQFYLSNSGNGALTILGIGTTGAFVQTNNCGTSLSAGAYCTINVVFAPSSPGAASGTVGIVDNNNNVSNSLQIVNLGGNGVTAPTASISPGSLTFATQLMETASASQTVTVGNAANAAQLIVTAVAATGDFSETNNCVGNLQGGSNCTINVTFTPTAAGSRTGTLTVTDNNNGTTGSTQTVSLTGWGRPAGENATPYISDISPVSAAPGGAKFVLTVHGGGFTAPELDWQTGKTVTKLTASNITDDSFTVTIPASLIHTAHTGTLTAVNPDSAPASGVSNQILFPVAFPAAAAIFSLTSITDGAGPTAVATADFNGDGRADVAVINSAGSISIFLNNGAGGFRLASRLPVGTKPAAIAVGDLNGDGRPDLVVVNSGLYPVSIFLGNGDGTFSTAATVAVGEQPAAVVVGDFNGDGYLDLAVANMGFTLNTASVSILLGNGDGTFGPLSTLSMGTDSPVALAAGDFNGDGKLDMAVVQQSGIVSILLGNGDGTFNAGATPAAASGSAIATGDFNGDGKVDLAVTDYAGGTVTILLGNGDGTFTAGSTPATGREPTWVAAGDFNGDGKLDLAVANYEDGTVTILHGNGDGTFTTAGTPGVGKSPMALAVADFNGDGKLDVAATSAQSISMLIQPSFSVSSAELSFTTAFGTTSLPQTVTVTNTGTGAVSFTSVTIGGAKAADFGWANDCGGSLLPAATCTIQATYTPDRKSERVSATLTLTDSEGKQAIALSGTDQ